MSQQPQQALVLWAPVGREEIPHHGLELTKYGDYSVPWNGGVKVRDWTVHYWKRGPAAQMLLVDDWLTCLTEYLDITSNVIAATANEFASNKELMLLYGGRAAFFARYPVLKDIKDYATKRRNETVQSFAKIRELEQDVLMKVLHPYSHTVISSHTGATTIAYLLQRYQFRDVVPFLNTAYYRRSNRKNTGKEAFITNSDWTSTKATLKAFGPHLTQMLQQSSVHQAELKKAGLAKYDVQDPHPCKYPERSPPHEFFQNALKWYQGEKHPGTQEPHVVKIDRQWLIDRDLELEQEYGVIVPYSSAYGSRPAIQD
ncbi:hypothetical protein EJ02DRAFT_471475 [Clathrospora elynae]|uniref:Uncharacterized protein n=1 Tax=Clathrospora elynae TaxID=706981 RepID=A0A6A5S5L6_9PLEO|nr:hypothetical protein EJ02DRAFT_471475 [Clathrospora elynae]